MKLITVTWSYNDSFDYENTILYKSYIKYNNNQNFINIHFNRNNYTGLEKEFSDRFGYQYEFILYRIFLLHEVIDSIPNDTIIFSDTDDVVCLGDIQTIVYDNHNQNIIFSSEQHRYPNESNITNWTPTYLYREEDNKNKNYLNAGLSIGPQYIYKKLLEDCINNVLPKAYKNFFSDQGVYTYYYINRNELVVLDQHTKYFLSTYFRDPNKFLLNNGVIINIEYNTKPLFIHDNGWNFGSPKFIEHFKLI